MDWSQRYSEVWGSFTDELTKVLTEAAKAGTPPSYHGLHASLRSVYDVPYHCLLRLSADQGEQGGGKRSGSGTGVFFEGMLAAVIFGALRQACSGVVASRNSYAGPAPPGLPKEPDLYAEHCGRKVVIEAKAQVFTGTVDYARELHAKHAAAGISYYLIGGWASASKSCLEQCASDARWISILTGRAAIAPLLQQMALVDEIVSDICSCSGAPNPVER